MATAIWNNVGHPTNVDGDDAGIVSPIDALLVINEINARQFSDAGTGRLPKQLEIPSPGHFFDVSCDNFVTPIDALQVINHINQGGEAGTNGTGVYPSAACSPQLVEGNGFSEEFTHELTLPDDSSAVRIHFQAPEFDTSSQNSIRDAFEIELSDAGGNPVSFPFVPNRDSVYNWSELLEPQFGAGAATTTSMTPGEDSTLTVNLSGMEAGSTIRVVARLVNNDSDDNTSVILRGFEVIEATSAAPIGFAGASSRQPTLLPLNMEDLEDVSGSFVPTYGHTTLVGDNELFTSLEVANEGSQAVTGRLIVAIDHISELDAAAMHPDGLLLDGRPYWDLTQEMDGDPLEPGESIRSREIAFLNDSGKRFSYKLSTYGSLNAAPTGFTSTPLTKIEAEDRYVYLAQAEDPDGQQLSYAKVAGPEGMLVDAMTGQVTWTTSPEIGSYSVILRATDPHGLFVEQDFSVEVLAALQNRPPLFVTDPVTVAIASSGFEITTVGVGDSPAGVAVVSGIRGPSLVTLNTGDQSLSQIDSLGNDRFDSPNRVSVGEPAPSGQVLRSGYSIDVGLPAFGHTNDANQIKGMDQADLNGDGTLDLVVSSFVEQWRPSRTYRQRINVTLGNPDGTFGEVLTVAELPADPNSKFSTLRVADFDNDGHLDILTTDRQASTLIFLRGEGEGNFADVVSTTLLTSLSHFKTVDLDQDGTLDLVGTLNSQKEFGYLLGNGDGTFADFVRVYGDPAGPNINFGPDRNYAAADMDGDGDIDIVLGDHLARTVNVLSNDGALGFDVVATLEASIPFYPFLPVTPDRVYTVFAADFNGDSHQDIAYTTFRASSNRQGGLGIYLGDGSGVNFVYQDGADAIVTFPDNAAGNSDPVDLDGDGDLDIVLASSAGGIGSAGQMPSVLINRGDGTFSTTNLTVPAFGKAPYAFNSDESNAKGVLVGDYNQDGLLDISAYRSLTRTRLGATFASVTVILADQPGVFASSSSLVYDAGVNSPKAFFQTGDFDNDGIVDLWSPSYQDISRTWLGLGDGSFRDPFPATPNIGNEALTSGTVEDFNQDGILDVFWNGGGGVQNGPRPRYLAALGNGDGTFEITFQEASDGRRPDWSDFNGDGYLDFASSNTDGVQIFLYDVDNPGTWVFDNEFLYSDLGTGVTGYSFAMSIDDFDQDGQSDIAVVAKAPDEPFRLVVYPGLGDGTFRTPVSTHFAESAADYTSPTWMATGDFNEDGNPDVAVYEHLSISVHLGIGDGTFGRTDIYPAFGVSNRSDPQLFVRDIDHDGHDDVLFADSVGSQSLGVLPGNGDGSFRDRIAYDVPTREGAVAFGDFDNDGREDVALNSQAAGNFAVLLNGVRQRLTDVVSVDLNGDGNEDVLASYTDSSRVKWFLGDNLGKLNRQPDLFTDFGPVALTVSDLDDDGSTEIITANRSARSISIFSGGVGNWDRNDIAVGQAPIDVLGGLVDDDAVADLLVIDEANNALWVLLGNGDNSFSQPVSVPLGDRPVALLLADIDADGNNDAVISLPDSNRVMILPGDGQGGFAAPQYVDLAGSPGAIAAVDFNQDGNLDLSVTLGDLNQVAIIYGRGQNQFARPQLIRVGDNPGAMSAEDADEDGRIDLIVSNQGDDTVSVIYNRFDPNEVYRYDADAIDPDDDPLTYAIVDGPGGLIINSETGALLWAASPDQVGEHAVTLSADDGRGAVATQSYRIDVQPARDNANPLLATEPETTIGANEVFVYQATALDEDNDAVRYRLLDGPAEATIESTTGLVTWDGRGEGRKFSEFGQAGSFQIAKDESFQTPSVTVEGWFNIHTLTASNGGTWLFQQRNSFNNTYDLGFLANNTIRFTARFAGQQIDYRVPFVQEADRWYHIALTIDDTSRTATIYVDGEVVGETPLPESLDYAGTFPLALNGGQASVDHFRVWSVARSQQEIQQGMAEQYDDNPQVTIDLRFDKSTSYTAHDSSLYRNDGYLVAGPGVPQPTSGLALPGQYAFTIGVEDGRGGYDEQSFSVEVQPELRGSILGHFFDDLNGDGDQDDGSEAGVPAEPPLENWQVYIDTNGNAYPDPHEPQTVTDANGNYRMAGLLPGDYPVRISPVAGYDVPTDSTNVTVAANEDAAFDLAAAQLAHSHIRGQLRTEAGDAIAYWKAFADMDGDGTRDETEMMAMSDREGNYALTGLGAGDYTIHVDLPAGWADTAGKDGLAVTLAKDEILGDIDFVLEPTNTSVTGGVHFVTIPSTNIEARQTFRYASIAMGISNDAITYDLSLAPEGMAIDPDKGLVAWRPAIEQVGEHLVILRATSASGSVALHDFTINVTAPDTLPVIVAPVVSAVGSPAGMAYVGINYAYDVIAQDAESTELTYALPQSPNGASIDPATGRLQWIPAASDVGSHDFSVEVTDEADNSSTVTWSVDVQDSSPQVLPVDVKLPRASAAVSTDFFSRITAHDSLGRPVTWSLTSGPFGLSVVADGAIQWTPAADQLGAQSVELLATTAGGATENVAFDIEVTGRSINALPSIVSSPVASVSLGQEFAYDVMVSDSDRDIFAFTLLEGPLGMSVHPSRGHVRWLPAEDQLGEHDVRIQVSDPSGGVDEQEFQLKVSRFGGPPRIASVPPTEASVGSAFLHSVQAIDSESDPLTYNLLTAPAGMTIVETTGEIAWTPTAGQVGQQDVVIQVSDGIGGAATLAFAINVSAGVPNLPPEITSSSPRFGSVGAAYSYTLVANDPENTAIVYSLGQRPTGMTVDSGSGQVSWTPTAGQEGKHVVTLIATDEGGASAIESFELDVLAQNTDPSINSNPRADVAAGALFMYDVLASDADLDQLTFRLVQAPAGATIDSFGRLRWETAVPLIGSHNFTLEVTDPRGGEAMQSFTLEVIEDLVAPKLSLIVAPGDNPIGNVPWGRQFKSYVKAIDNVAIASITLKANGQDIPLDAAGTAEFTFQQWGFSTITVTATAVDTNANITTKTVSFAYDFPEGWSGAGGDEVPTAIITSPADAESVTGMVSITGTAAHDDFALYKLSYRHVDDSAFTEFFESTTPVTNGELGVWDTSLLLNDEYVIRLQVATTETVVNVVDINVGLAGELKLGNFQLSFTDMVIPVAGIPIEITRIYDTLHADWKGDFGYGWRLEYRNTELRVGLPKSGLEDIGIYSALRPGVKVYLNVPGKGRQGFTFTPDIRVLPGWGGNNLVLARPRFTPDPGVTSTLSTGVSQYLQVNEQGELHAPGGIPYNPASPDFDGAYELTTREGINYRIDGTSGNLLSAIDANGVRVEYSDSAITSSAGSSLQISRDFHQRITGISDPNSETVLYRYSTAGNLQQVTDRTGNTTTFSYDAFNRLVSVDDPLGRPIGKVSYDENGRVTKTLDGVGAEYSISYDLDNELVIETDPAGGITATEYDAFGHVVASTDQLGATTRFEYDARGQLIRQVSPEGSTVQTDYDHNGRETARTESSGATTRFQYDAAGNLLVEINQLGEHREFSYDSHGQLDSVQDFDGATTDVTYSDSGRLLGAHKINGVSRSIDRDQRGFIQGVVDPTGLNSTVQTNDLGAVVSQTFHSTTGDITYARQFDAEGRLTAEIDPLGNQKRYEYDAAGRLTRTIDELNRVTETTYNGVNDPIRTDFSDVTEIVREYDLNGNVTSETDRAGNETRFEYDSVGNLVAILLPDATPEFDDNPRQTFQFDLERRMIQSTNEFGETTRFAYSSNGSLIRQEFPSGETIQFSYDALGRETKRIQNDGSITTSEYLGGRSVRTEGPDGNVTLSEFDLNGNRTSFTDGAGRTTTYLYSDAGFLTHTILPDGSTTQREYDDLGNVTSITDPSGRETTFSYDALKRVQEQRDNGQLFRKYEYDAAGQLQSRLNGVGEQLDFTYDTNGNLSTIGADGHVLRTYQYDSHGRVTQAEEGDRTSQMEYDQFGNLVSISQPNGIQITFVYDGSDRLVSTSVNGVATVEQQYDEFGRLADIALDSVSVAGFEYGDDSILDSIVYGSGLVETREYNARGHLRSKQVVNSEANLFDLQMQRDASGLVTQRVSGGNTSTFAYDENGLLSAELHRDNQNTLFDAQYVYGANGDRVTEQIDGQVRDLVYNRSRQLVGDSRGLVRDYDGEGRLVRSTENGEVTEYSYDWDGRLVEILKSENGAQTSKEEFEYDYLGNLIDYRFNDQPVATYAVDVTKKGAPRIATLQSGQIVERLIRDASGVPLAVSDTAGIRYQISDHLGTIVAEIDSSMQVTPRHYSAFGLQLQSGVNPAGTIEYTGGGRFSEGELDYMGARFYQPEFGQFTSVDSFPGFGDLPISESPYQYAGLQPLNANDPTGELTLAEASVVLNVISIGASALSLVATFTGYSKAANALSVIGVVTGIGSLGTGLASAIYSQLGRITVKEASKKTLSLGVGGLAANGVPFGAQAAVNGLAIRLTNKIGIELSEIAAEKYASNLSLQIAKRTTGQLADVGFAKLLKTIPLRYHGTTADYLLKKVAVNVVKQFGDDAAFSLHYADELIEAVRQGLLSAAGL